MFVVSQPLALTVSAGYDAAEGDELGTCKVTPAGYAHMTHMLSSLANGKLVLALEVRALWFCPSLYRSYLREATIWTLFHLLLWLV